MRRGLSTRLTVGCFLLGTLYFLPLTSVSGQTNIWINPASGKWEVPPNWSIATPSIFQSGCVISNAGNKTVSLDNVTAGVPNALTINNLTISAPMSTTNTLSIAMNNPAAALHLFDGLILSAGGLIYITNSMLVADVTTAGKSNVLESSLTVATGGTLLATNATTYVGSAIGSTGQLTVGNGGTAMFVTLTLARTNGSSGSVLVNGGQMLVSNVLFIGATGTGQMTVNSGLASNRVTDIGGHSGINSGGSGTLNVAGGTFYSQLGTFIGYNPGETGSVWITGGTNTFGSTTAIGVGGSGQMTISNGAVTMFYPALAFSSGSAGTLTFAGGNTTAYQLQDGTIFTGTGVVWMTGGSLTLTSFSNSTVYAGYGGNGSMTVSNGTLTTLYLDVGYAGLGNFNLAGNGIVSVLSNMTVALNGTGSFWMNGGQLLVPSGSITDGFYYGTGQITISNGAAVAQEVVVGGKTVLALQGFLTMAGGSLTVLNDLTVGDCSTNSVGTVAINAGTVFVTNATHTAFIDVRNGTFTVNGGTLVADVLVMTNSCGRFIHNGGNVSIGTLMLDPNLSATGDGLPNGWKQQYGLDPLSTNGVNGINGDPDGDGMNNLQEYLAGTNPTDSASYFHITSVLRTNNNLLLSWMTAVGRTNALQVGVVVGGNYTTNFKDIFTVTNVTSTSTNYLDAGGATNIPARYYRVRLVP